MLKAILKILHEKSVSQLLSTRDFNATRPKSRGRHLITMQICSLIIKKILRRKIHNRQSKSILSIYQLQFLYMNKLNAAFDQLK